MMEEARLCCLATAWLFLDPDTELDHCPRILLSCFRGRTSAPTSFLSSINPRGFAAAKNWPEQKEEEEEEKKAACEVEKSTKGVNCTALCSTGWGGHLFRRFRNMFSESSPCLLVQHGSYRTAQYTIHNTANSLGTLRKHFAKPSEQVAAPPGTYCSRWLHSVTSSRCV